MDHPLDGYLSHTKTPPPPKIPPCVYPHRDCLSMAWTSESLSGPADTHPTATTIMRTFIKEGKLVY